MASGDAVANEPRLFVGQIPADCTEEDLWPVFQPFGTVRNLHILRGPDSKPRGCAMVLYARWAQAENAAEALDGAAALTAGQGRPLVVHFANPRKPPPGQPAELGLAPKKLFVGQVPRDVTEDMLRPFFESYGEIEHINILRTQRGQSAGCGFVQFRKWAQAENAMEAHNGKTRLGNSEVPLVVKFADAKRREQPLPALGVGYKRNSFFPDGKHLVDPAEFAMYQLGQQWTGLLPQANPMLGNGLLNSQLALQQGMQNLIANAYPGAYPQLPGSYGLGDPGMMPQGLRLPEISLSGNGLADGRLQDTGLHATHSLGSGGGNLSSQTGLTGGPSSDPLAGQLLSNTGSLGTPVARSSLSPGLPLTHAGASGSMGSLPVSTTDLAQQLSELNIASLSSQHAPSEGSSGTPFAGPAQPHPAGISAALTELSSNPGLSAPQIASAFHSLSGGVPSQTDMQNLYLQSVRANMPSQLQGVPSLGAIGGRFGDAARPWGQKIGSSDKYNEWKLFVGQVPLEATEEDLWALFAPIGQIFELYILRNSNQKSRGCAFVTYASKGLAEQAITQLNGRQMASGKTLVVKFADRASSNRALQAASPLLNLYMR